MKPRSSPPIFWISSPPALAEPPKNGLLVSSTYVSRWFLSPTGSNNVINDENLLAGLDGIGLHLEEILTILLLVALGFTGAGELALLAHGDETGTETQRQAGSHKEATGLEADNDIGLLAVVGEDVKFQGADQGLMQSRIGKDRQDILEQNSRGGEIRELAQGGAQSYLKTGEFGGAGGIGGGESDFGGIWGSRGHYEEGREEEKEEVGSQRVKKEKTKNLWRGKK